MGLEGFRVWRETENTIRHHLKRCIGLAMSNPHVVAAHYEATHILYACGHCINCPVEREAAIRFLHGVREQLGWSIDHVVDHLENWNRS